MILIIVVVAVVATSGFYFVNKESSFHDWFFLKITNQPTAVVYIFDSSALVANIFVLFLSLLRFRERWVISVIGDLVLLVE
jgi:hypothetical protein